MKAHLEGVGPFVFTLALSAEGDQGEILNPVLPSYFQAGQPLGLCLKEQIAKVAGESLGSVSVFAGSFQKYEDPSSENPAAGVAEVVFVTDLPNPPAPRSSFVIELVTTEANGWRLQQDMTGFRMYAANMKTTAAIKRRHSADVLFMLDLTVCEPFLR